MKCYLICALLSLISVQCFSCSLLSLINQYLFFLDVWSAGCVLAELLLGQPIFPGASSVDQLVEIIKVLGTPTREQIKEMNPHYTEFKFPQIKPHPWSKVWCWWFLMALSGNQPDWNQLREGKRSCFITAHNYLDIGVDVKNLSRSLLNTSKQVIGFYIICDFFCHLNHALQVKSRTIFFLFADSVKTLLNFPGVQTQDSTWSNKLV